MAFSIPAQALEQCTPSPGQQVCSQEAVRKSQAEKSNSTCPRSYILIERRLSALVPVR